MSSYGCALWPSYRGNFTHAVNIFLRTTILCKLKVDLQQNFQILEVGQGTVTKYFLMGLGGSRIMKTKNWPDP